MTKREQVVKVAEKLVAKGRVDSAIKEYLKVLKENPNDVSTLNRLGDLYARISSIDDAVRLFTQIAEQYTEDGFLVKAIAIYKKIIKLDPTRLQVYESLAALYHKQGLTTEARTQYQVLGDYYLKHHDNAAAINIYQKMAELEPDNPSHHLKLAELFQQGQLWEKALRSYRTIAELMLQHGRVDEAVRVYQRAIEVHSDDLGFITDAVMGIKDAGHTGAAARLLASAVARNPQAEKVARLAGLRQASGDPRETLPPPRAAAPAPAAPTRPSPPRPAPPPPAPREEEFLVLDLDEGPSGSLVSPPEDMQEPGSAFLRPPPAKPPESLPQRLGPAALEPDAWTQEPPEPAAAEAADVESSGSWGSDSSISGFSFEMPDLTVPAEEAAAPPAGEPFQLDLEEEEAPLPWEEPPPPPEPEEELAATEPSSELELDLAQLEIEPLDEEVPAPAFEQPSFAETSLGTASEDTGFELELEDEGAAAPWETPAIGLPPA
ncbi:MAG TPA: tetratricopeptide repeat protein, partial [Thermoanaerobaculia bacterium]|nr:tetratricopeptide repeat protein [Thermoanaerobaculia bacterium]